MPTTREHGARANDGGTMTNKTTARARTAMRELGRCSSRYVLMAEMFAEELLKGTLTLSPVAA